MSAFRLLLLAAVMLMTTSCHSANSSYSADDALGKGEAPNVPNEFKAGTATLKQAKAWSKAVLSASLMGDGAIKTEEHNLIPGRRPAIFISDQSVAGTGGNEYMVFEPASTGLRYLGDISFGRYVPAPPDAATRPRVITYWHLSADEGTMTLWLLTDDGFTQIKSIALQAGDEGSEKDNRIFDSFFGSQRVTNALLDAMFGITDLNPKK